MHEYPHNPTFAQREPTASERPRRCRLHPAPARVPRHCDGPQRLFPLAAARRVHGVVRGHKVRQESGVGDSTSLGLDHPDRLPEVSAGKLAARPRLEISLEFKSFVFAVKCGIPDEFPGNEFGRVRGFSSVVIGHPLSKVGSSADIALFWRSRTADYVNIPHRATLVRLRFRFAQAAPDTASA